MNRARSRLASSSSTAEKKAAKRRVNRSKNAGVRFSLSEYVRFLPTLLLGVLALWGLLSLMQRVYPQQLADVIVPQLYLPFIGLFWVTVFLLGSVLLLNSRRGLLLAIGLSLLVLFKLQAFVITPGLVGVIVGPLIGVELVATLISRR